MIRKILLVEDEADILKMYHIALTKLGFVVDTASDGQEALTKLQAPENKYDLLLLDIMLPKIDGIQVLKTIKQETSSVKQMPVFLLTNLGAPNILNEALSLGADRYFIKTDILPGDIAHTIDAFFQKTN